MAQGTEAAPRVSGCEKDAESLLDTVLRAPAPRSHQFAATRRQAQPSPAPAPKAQDHHLETRPLLIPHQGLPVAAAGAAVREVAEFLKHRVVSPTHVRSAGVPLKPAFSTAAPTELKWLRTVAAAGHSPAR